MGATYVTWGKFITLHKDKDSIAEFFTTACHRYLDYMNGLVLQMRETRRRTLVFDAFTDGNTALILVATRFRQISATIGY